ncbi:hypothetical protein [Novosphingobium naphthalenivorans]|nr:hypothetical protein [Novosphingobium naphthalenivorans]
MIRRTILVAASISFIGAMLTSLMAQAGSTEPVGGLTAADALVSQ